MKTYFIQISVILICISCTFSSANSLDSLPEKDIRLADKELLQTLPSIDSFRYNLPWLSNYEIENMILNRIAVPQGYERFQYRVGTFAHWLNHLPLLSGTPSVKLYNGQPKPNQMAHAFILDIDVGDKDLQQCADAAMRLRAEYLYSNAKKDSISFNYTNGAKVPYSKWQKGYMPVPKSGGVDWVASSKAGDGYEKFKAYMIQIFNYAGTLSLSKELKPVSFENLQPGDLLLKGGAPGHAVMIMDMAFNATTGDKVFLISQSYMPAQQIHILKNLQNTSLSPWYSMQAIHTIINTPEWTFDTNQVMRWN